MLKQLLCILVSTAIITTATGGSINAFEKESKAGNNMPPIVLTDNKELDTIDYDDFEITVTENDATRTVVTYDKVAQETSTVIYDKVTKQLHDEKGNYLGTGYAIASRGVYGPFKAYFDINPASVGVIVATAGAAGVGFTALKAGLTKLFSYGGGGTFLERWFPNASINRYFEYKQELSGTRARNINRKFYTRIGRTGGYTSYSYGNGGWFDTVKPY